MKLRRSTILPLVMLVYLAVMAYIGYENHVKYYWWILVGSLLIIVALHLALRKKEALQKRREDEAEYGTYDKDE